MSDWLDPPALRRRRFLELIGGGAASLALAPLVAGGCGGGTASGRRFFTSTERATLTALVDRILPADHDPGAVALGAVDFIERLLTAFDGDASPARIYAGGPVSGREPFPDSATGTPTDRFPANDFARFLPLDRLQELRWRAELFGTAATPGADFNDATLGPRRGLRDIYREALARVDALAIARAGASFAALPIDQQDALLPELDGSFAPENRRGVTFTDLAIEHTLEGCFAAPEYGGNRGGDGWRMLGLDGDVHPLGYSIFSSERGDYVERADRPMSTPNPDELDARGQLAPRPLGADAERIQRSIALVSNLVGNRCGGF